MMRLFVGCLVIFMAIVFMGRSEAIGAGQYGGTWKRQGTVVSPHDDVTEVSFSGISTTVDASTLNGEAGTHYIDIRNQAGFLNITNVTNWDSSVSIPTSPTGVDEHNIGVNSCKVTVNAGDDSKIDIEECNIHVLGPHYPFAAMSSIDPDLGAGENSKFIGMTLNGYTTSESRWTGEQKLTIVPLARVNTAFGVSGPGSTISLIRDDRYFITKRDYYDRLMWEEAMGAQYVTGGEIFANSTSGLILGQTAGVLYDGQTKRQVLSSFANMSAVFLHLSSSGGFDWISDKRPLVVDAVSYNPSGLGLTPLLNDNKFKVDTILKSPKGADGVPEGGWFYVYGDTEYATQADALAAVADGSAFRFGLFINQPVSGLVPLALIVQQKNATEVDTIIDQRPCLVCRP